MCGQHRDEEEEGGGRRGQGGGRREQEFQVPRASHSGLGIDFVMLMISV